MIRRRKTSAVTRPENGLVAHSTFDVEVSVFFNFRLHMYCLVCSGLTLLLSPCLLDCRQALASVPMVMAALAEKGKWRAGTCAV